jgi:hypothetical protein
MQMRLLLSEICVQTANTIVEPSSIDVIARTA